MKVFLTLILFIVFQNIISQNFTPGRITALRVGAGTGSLSNVGTPVFIDEFNTTGPNTTPTKTVALPTTTAGGINRLVLTGNATTEGLMTLSSDKNYLVLGGYDAAVGANNVTASANNRVLARINYQGNIETVVTTAFTQTSTGNSATGAMRGAASVDGSGFYLSGGSSGVLYVPFSTGAVTFLSTTSTNNRAVGIYNGNLYVSSASSTNSPTKVFQVGTGLPTTSGQTNSTLTGVAAGTSNSPNQFFMADLTGDNQPDVLYIAEDIASTGLLKYKYNPAIMSWEAAGSIQTSVRGLTGRVVNGTDVELFATTTETSANKIVKAYDANANARALPSSFTDVATAPANTAFRGIAFSPENSTLSINYENFKGMVTANNQHQLDWKITCSATQGVNFDIQASTDGGRKYKTINSFYATKQRCDLPFSFINQYPADGTTYYRIVTTDDNNKTTYSNIVILSKKSKYDFDVVLWSNPVVNNQLTLNINSNETKQFTHQIVGLDGKIYIQQYSRANSGLNTVQINLKNLANGVYFIKTTSADGALQVNKFIKN